MIIVSPIYMGSLVISHALAGAATPPTTVAAKDPNESNSDSTRSPCTSF